MSGRVRVSKPGPPLQLALRWLLTVAILGLLAYSLDMELLLSQLGQVSLLLVFVSLVVTVLQVVLSAWRWRYTSRKLGLNLKLTSAIREYYLATFINQVLPGGVLGDVNRAWRQSRDTAQKIAAAHAVVIERFSGQLTLVLMATALVVGFWPFRVSLSGQQGAEGVNPVWWVLAALVVVAALCVAGFRKPLLRYLRHLGSDLRLALLGWPALAVQLVTSAGIVVTYLSVFMLLAWGLAGEDTGMVTDWLILLPLCAGLLLAMSLPLTVAGWGVREGVAILLWPMAGLPAEQGAALSVAYGLLVLVSSLPGALVLLAGVSARPGQIQVK